MRTATFTVTLSSASSLPVSVHWATVPGSATAPSDFTASSGTLTFSPGQTLKTVQVAVLDNVPGEPTESFSVVLSDPANGTILDGTGICTIPGAGAIGEYLDRFEWTYGRLKDTTSGFWGPPSGAKARTIPYHSIETLIVEAPDWGHQSSSETISFWAKLEAWKVGMSGDTAGYLAMWNCVETNYIPSLTNQPLGSYNAALPATYQPEEDIPSDYPVLPNTGVSVGSDPLYNALLTAYGTKSMYLMHWMWDVDGAYGFRNGDGATVQVAINSFQRGMQESSWETVTQAEWEDWTQQASGGNAHGYLPIFAQAKPEYPAAPFDYAKQWRYTCAPDAEVRLVASGFMASQFATAAGSSLATQDTKTKRMGDYLRYSLYDKYFKPIPGYDGSGAHNLIAWYVAWGGEIPAPGVPGAWGFRIGASECHHGYNGVDIAYMMATSGEGYTPVTPGAGTQWQGALARQLEMIRWLQTPQGPIAGGVSNSWNGRYETPSDGREDAKFYGMYYTYSPVWHDPPSNRWFGFQAWGLERVARLYLMVANKTGSFNTDIRTKVSVILDRWVPWLLDNATLVGADSFTLPINLSWTSDTEVVGETATSPNHEGVYEYLPTLNWDSSGDYASFWNASLIPNANLHCSILDSGVDLGSAAATAQLLIQYAQAKRLAGGSLSNIIPNSAHTVQEAFTLAKEILDRIWATYKDVNGFTHDEVRADYNRYDDPIYLPPGYSGLMPNGDALTPGVTTFISMRSFMLNDPSWPDVQAYLDGGAAPTFRYNRFWHTTEVACGFAMIHKYFSDVVYV